VEILSYGATGSQGFPVARKLLAAGRTVRVLTREPSRVRDLGGARILVGDMADRDCLTEASRGVDGVFLHVPFFTERPDDGLNYAKNAVTAAVAAGRCRAARMERQRRDSARQRRKLCARHAARYSGRYYRERRSLRSVSTDRLYGELFRPLDARRASPRRYLRLPDAAGGQDAVAGDRRCRDVRRLRLCAPRSGPMQPKNQRPRTLEWGEVAERFSRALGRKITFRAMPAEEFGRKLEAVFPGMGQGAAQGYAAAYEQLELFSSRVDVAGVLEQIPVPLTTLEAWATRHKAAFS